MSTLQRLLLGLTLACASLVAATPALADRTVTDQLRQKR